MATSLAEADSMIDVAREAGRIVLIKICSHSFGRRWDWQTLRRFGGGELNNNATHLIDQALQLLGSEEPEVMFRDLQRTLTLGDAEDHVKIVLSASGSPVVDIELTRACAYPQDWWLVVGD